MTLSWCDRSFILLNVEKTKDMSIDLRKKSSAATVTLRERKSGWWSTNLGAAAKNHTNKYILHKCIQEK